MKDNHPRRDENLPADLEALRGQLRQQCGKEYWRSLEELANTEAFQSWLEREFPRGAAQWDRSLSRRQFLKLMLSSLGLAGLTACAAPAREKIVPYVHKPEPLLPGEPLFFATTFPLGGIGLGLVVESREGRPIKVEGNIFHPASLGATDAFAQATVLQLYDPDRSQAPSSGAEPRRWEAFWRDLSLALERSAADEGAGVAVLTETTTSPALAAQLKRFLAAYPQARWHQYQPANRDNFRQGSQLAFGEYVEAVYHLDQADVILSLDSELLDCTPMTLRYVHDFAERRRVYEGERPMNRLYAVESTLTLTGAAADHRLPLRSHDVEAFARALAAELGVDAGPVPPLPEAVPAEWLAALAQDLRDHRGASLVVAGQVQPPSVHALAHALNAALDNAGNTVTYHEALEVEPVDETESLRALVAEMFAGRVDTLLILSSNPVYSAPADLDFEAALAQVDFSVHLGLYRNETAERCTWHIPEAHFLEAWGDVRAYDGTVSLIQPLIVPLYSGLSAMEFLARASGLTDATGYDLLREYWQEQFDGDDFESFWRTSLHTGFIPDTTQPERTVMLQGLAGSVVSEHLPGLEIVFRPDPSVYDGRFANNAWLQELPKPISKLTWDNAVFIGPATAARLGLETEDLVELRLRDRSVVGPVWVMPGHAAESVTVHLGYGRTAAGLVGTGQGFNAYRIRTSDNPWIATGLEIVPTGQKYSLASTQPFHLMEGRNLVRSGTVQQWEADPEFAQRLDELEAELTLYPEYEYPGNRWGMVIDLTSCVGCNACVIACQAENNIPVVGKEQVEIGREMHWLRVDSYFTGEPDFPDTVFQPVPCMHCEKAPCEPVCPVAATVHSDDGLNEMIYNRCVGTRYCSNNCPYKVRRFNFFDYAEAFEEQPILKMLQNPEVTVRSLGVMEKCTYCVQRIRQAQAQAEEYGVPIPDGAVVTACQGACPTEAIVFGDLNDENSAVARRRALSLNYALLGELNTQPRTTYLAQLRNPNPLLEQG